MSHSTHQEEKELHTHSRPHAYHRDSTPLVVEKTKDGTPIRLIDLRRESIVHIDQSAFNYVCAACGTPVRIVSPVNKITHARHYPKGDNHKQCRYYRDSTRDASEEDIFQRYLFKTTKAAAQYENYLTTMVKAIAERNLQGDHTISLYQQPSIRHRNHHQPSILIKLATYKVAIEVLPNRHAATVLLGDVKEGINKILRENTANDFYTLFVTQPEAPGLLAKPVRATNSGGHIPMLHCYPSPDAAQEGEQTTIFPFVSTTEREEREEPSTPSTPVLYRPSTATVYASILTGSMVYTITEDLLVNIHHLSSLGVPLVASDKENLHPYTAIFSGVYYGEPLELNLANFKPQTIKMPSGEEFKYLLDTKHAGLWWMYHRPPYTTGIQHGLIQPPKSFLRDQAEYSGRPLDAFIQSWVEEYLTRYYPRAIRGRFGVDRFRGKPRWHKSIDYSAYGLKDPSIDSGDFMEFKRAKLNKKSPAYKKRRNRWKEKAEELYFIDYPEGTAAGRIKGMKKRIRDHIRKEEADYTERFIYPKYMERVIHACPLPKNKIWQNDKAFIDYFVQERVLRMFLPSLSSSEAASTAGVSGSTYLVSELITGGDDHEE